MPAQIPLSLTIPQPPLDFTQFRDSENLTVVAHLREVIHGRDESVMYIYGPPDSGKTHLLQAACAEVSHQDKNPAFLPLVEIDTALPAAVEGLEYADLVCLDDVQTIAGQADCEQALFGLFNQLRERGVPLVVSGCAQPRGLPFILPDLVSRLAWGGVFALAPPSPPVREHILDGYARQLGLELPAKITTTLVAQGPGEVDALKSCLDALNQESLAARRKITVAMVRRLLKSQQAA